MAKRKKPTTEDEEQSARFIQTARELEAAGELNLTDAEERFESAMRRAKLKTDAQKSRP